MRIENQIKLMKANAPDVDTLPDEIALKHFKFYPGKFELHTNDGVVKLSHRGRPDIKDAVQP